VQLVSFDLLRSAMNLTGAPSNAFLHRIIRHRRIIRAIARLDRRHVLAAAIDETTTKLAHE
jgi:hypothetical protein